MRPDFWDRGVAQRLLAATMELFERWEIRHAGLFTFAESPKHVALYQKFGFTDVIPMVEFRSHGATEF